MTESAYTRRAALAAGAALLVACANPMGASGAEKKGRKGKGQADAPAPTPTAPAPAPAADPAAAKLGKCNLYLPKQPGEATRWKYADTPAWARNTPAWYVPVCNSAGSALLQFSLPTGVLTSKISKWSELSKLYDEAQSLGTKTIYLCDWYQGQPNQPTGQWWTNKGDYVVREDMGGKEAFAAAIEDLHAKGGRIILYVEPFIIHEKSKVGQEHGAEWSIMTPDGPPTDPYPRAWKLCPACDGWVEHMEKIATFCARDLKVDGLFLDSYGFQDNWACVAKNHGHAVGKKEVFNEGAVALVARIRKALQAERPDAVILTEGPTMAPLFAYTDGSLDWGVHRLVERWLWDAQGETDTFTSGWSIDDLHQILAIGAKLALPPQFLEAPPGSSAAGWVDERRKEPVPDDKKDRIFYQGRVAMGVHQWRNAGLLLGLAMPGLDDVCPRRGEDNNLFKDAAELTANLDAIRERAVAIDGLLAGKKPGSPASAIQKLLNARAKLVPAIDEGCTMEQLTTGNPDAAAWRFTGGKGAALTAVNLGNAAVELELACDGAWVDHLTGDKFTGAGGKVKVAVPAHGVRLMGSA